jgi:ABC-type amino acid transport substrate-binding protein
MLNRFARSIAIIAMTASAGACTPTLRLPDPTPTMTPVATVQTGTLVASGFLTVCSDLSRPPQDMINGGVPLGSDIDISREMATRLGLTLKVENIGMADIRNAVNAGNCDIAVAGIRDSSDTAKGFDLIAYLQVSQIVLLRKDNPAAIAVQNDLCGRGIAVMKGSDEEASIIGVGSYSGRGLSDACIQSGHTAIQARGFVSDSDAVSAVLSGDVDAFLADSALAGYELQQHGDTLAQVKGVTMTVDTESIVLLQGKPDLRAAIAKVLESMQRDGTYGKILAKYGIASLDH